MIEKKINNLKLSLRNMHMSEDDKRDVFKRVNLVIDKIEAVSSEYHQAPVVSPFANKMFGRGFTTELFVYIKQRKFVPSMVAVFLLMVTGGFSALAEGALPGDSLYSLKVNVNEQVKGIVAVTPEAKARLAVETTERRLQEAVVLSSQGKLTDAKKQILKEQLDKSAGDVKNSVASLVALNNISAAKEVSINFEASLKTHELILDTISKNTNATSSHALVTASSTSSSTPVVAINVTATPVSSLVQDIRQEINLSAEVRQNLIQKEILEINSDIKLADKLKIVKSQYADLLNQKKTLVNISPASLKMLESNLGIASTSITETEKAPSEKDLTKAISALQKAIKAMSDADSVISIELNMLPETKKAMDLIDINKLIDSAQDSIATSSNATSAGEVLGTSTSATSTSATSTSPIQ